MFTGWTDWTAVHSLVTQEAWLAASIVGGVTALAATRLAIRLSHRWGILDIPDERKQHDRPMPLLGGPALCLAFGVGCGAALVLLPAGEKPAPLIREIGATAAAGALLVAIGVADDRRGLSTWVRLAGQIIAAGLVMAFGARMSCPFAGVAGPAAETALTLVWLVGITNAMNFLDGLDGLASGLSAVAAVSFGAIAILTGQRLVAAAAFALAGSALGFLRYNVRPARIFLGDSGSTFLGFTLACLALIGDWGAADGEEALLNLFVSAIVLGIPIYDMTYTTVYRFGTGRVHTVGEWLAYVGRDHLHHRLLALGLRPGRACLLICLGGVALGLLALVVVTRGGFDRLDKWFALALAAGLFVGATALMELGRKGRGR
jgi:UDP-GlcNAc:undecaprenyl-phosphate GlcNAc-1-phosphate transferase